MALMSSWSLRLRTLLVALVPACLMFLIMLAYHVSVRLQDAGFEAGRPLQGGHRFTHRQAAPGRRPGR